MKNIKLLAIMSILLLSAACVPTQRPQTFAPAELASQLNAGDYQQKVDNFIVIFDASSSMSGIYQGERKFEQAKVFTENLNNAISDLNLQGGIRAFGPRSNSLADTSSPLYGMTTYNHEGFASALAKLDAARGTTPMPRALLVSSKDLAGSKGTIAAILLSDAEDVEADSVNAAQAMKSAYGDRICIYPVLFGDAPGSRQIMTKIADEGRCGFVSTYNSLTTPQDMASFVKNVFLKKRVMKAVVADKKQDKDSDRDGILDSKDRCPGTPYGIKVNAVGCPLPIVAPKTIELQVEFGFNKYFVQSKYHRELENFANFMKSFPELNVTLAGHTDSVGSKEYNQKLSLKRAKSVKKYLEAYFNIKPTRIKTVGYGVSQPIATNKTDNGRQRNRRVYATLSRK